MAPFLIHYHAPGSMRDLRYDGYVDDLLRKFTVFECMEDLDWRKHLHFDAKADGRVLGFEEDTWKEADPLSSADSLQSLRRASATSSPPASIWTNSPLSGLPRSCPLQHPKERPDKCNLAGCGSGLHPD